MKKFTRISSLACLLLAALTFTLASCDKDDNDKKNLKFSPSDKVGVVVGSTATVTVSGGTSPYAAAPSDTKIATTTVDKSTITIKGVAKGTATVVVTDKDKNSGKITVTVKEGLSFDKTSVEVEANKETVVNITGGTAPYAAETKDATIASATIDGNKITVKGLKAGKTTITVTDKDKKNIGTVSVTVK
ncbi:pilus assembly protein N-terminal domain-containing protein [Proteiniphilum sp. X52]|uniref:pilus assembly protein N-terminal domain-containing protein n=1 Tax=Proteiniphilum sp. X52 TaxID=2382159 RepID=UPI000F0A7FD4|nr:pilus assembly protein N-terminal domain-containing protein [Proteiniphilum sp. X52]RNC67042.1 hypothetical protein D7D25_02050 [Proteiniphilum sp. X52]